MIYLYEINDRYEVHTDNVFAEEVLNLGNPVMTLTEEEWSSYGSLARKIDGQLFLGKTYEEMYNEKADEVRLQRDDLLLQSDWTLLRAIETGNTVPTEWSDYRQALRDIPQQEGFPFEVEYPQKPQE